MLGLSDSERISMIHSAVLIQYTRVTDRRTDGRTDGIGVAYTRYSYMLSRVKIDNFPYPTPIPAKIWVCSLWSRSVVLGFTESEMVRLISREIIFAEFQPI